MLKKSLTKEDLLNNDLVKNVIPFDNENCYEKLIDGNLILFSIVDITSRDACNIIEDCNNNNRPISKKNVIFIRNEMLENNWIFDGTPIRFDAEGNLQDGQHRLMALSETENKSYPFLIQLGLNKKAFNVMDVGKKRSAADVFAIEGVKQPKIASTAIKLYWTLNNNLFALQTSMNKGLSNKNSYRVYIENPDFDSYVQKAINHNASSGKKLLSDSTVAAFWYLFAKTTTTKDADEFMTKLLKGTGLEEGSPILLLREKLVDSKMNINHRLKRAEKNKYVALAFKKFRNGVTLKSLNLPRKQIVLGTKIKNKTT